MVTVILLLCGAALFLIPANPIRVEAQAVEVACPTGSIALPAGIIINPVNGKIRQLLCMDSVGNVVITTNLTNFPNGFSISNTGGQSLSFTASDIVLQTFGGQNIKFNNAVTLLTTAFASLGTVPAAGVGTKYCTDCTTAAICAGAGSGHLAVSNGTNWTCQ